MKRRTVMKKSGVFVGVIQKVSYFYAIELRTEILALGGDYRALKLSILELLRSGHVNSFSMLFLAISLCFLACSCSVQYKDKDGNHRVIGMTNMTLKSSESAECSAEKIGVKTVGIAISALPSHGGIYIGYSQNSTTSIPLVVNPSEQIYGVVYEE